MTESERIEEWLRHYKVCHLKMNALCAVLENDGEQMLSKVLRRLGLERSLDLVRESSNKNRQVPQVRSDPAGEVN